MFLSQFPRTRMRTNGPNALRHITPTIPTPPAQTDDSGDEDTGSVTVTDYVGNKNTKKFHYDWCGSVGKMKESNKYYYTGTRDEMIAKGYKPCGNCNP